MTIGLTYLNGLFQLTDDLAHETFCELPISEVKAMGWKHNVKDGWFTTNPKSASLLRDFADEKAKNIFKRTLIQFSPWKGALLVPKGLSLIPHQGPSALFSLNRNKSCLGLKPGLGKSIIAALIASAIGGHVLYICPPSLTFNALEEFQKWAPTKNTKILDNVDYIVPDILIVPDSQISNPYVRDYVRFFAPELINIDEAHRIKNPKTQRTKACYGYRDNRRKINVPGIMDGSYVKKIVLMSGTFMPSRPIEIWPMLNKMGPEFIGFKNYEAFGHKYCSPKWNGFGYDFSGCNMKELKNLGRHFITQDPENMTALMLKMDKKILGLPPLTKEMVILSEDMPKELKSMDMALLRKYSPEDLVKQSIAQSKGKDEGDLHIATYRKLLGKHKIKSAMEYIIDQLDENEEDKIVIFGYHIDVMKEAAVRLKNFKPLLIHKDLSMSERHAMVKEFQSNPERRVFLGNGDIIGTGLTLTKANRIFFLEWPWTPGEIQQWIDRVHRYTLEHPVHVQFLIFRNSMDRKMFETVTRKESITAIV